MIPSEYTFVRETQTHKVYKCPHCLSRRGKPDNQGKLYICKSLGIGYCFKCMYVFRDPDFQFVSIFSDPEEVKKVKTSLLDLSYTKKVFDYKDSVHYNYLVTRGFSPDEILEYSFRIHTMWGYDCIIIPNRIINYNKTDYYQVKIINGDNLKYFNLNNYDKPLTNISGIKNKRKLIICEGFFTAHSASSLPECDSVSILGKTLTPLQSGQLTDLAKNYDEIIIGLDEDVPLNQKESLYTSIRKIYDGIISCIFIPDTGGKKDFNDMQFQELQNLYEQRVFIGDDTFNYIRTGFLKI